MSPASASLVARNAVHDLGGEHAIVGTYGNFLLVLICQMGAATAEVTCTSVMPAFSEDEPVYLSPVRSGVVGASHVLRETLFSLQAAPALASPSRPLRADELLPERALLGDDYARAVAGSYAEPESVHSELEEARALMKRLGCFVVRTDGKAIEESAAEIISHLEEIQEARARRAARRA